MDENSLREKIARLADEWATRAGRNCEYEGDFAADLADDILALLPKQEGMVARTDVENAPSDGEFLAENRHGDWIPVCFFDVIGGGPRTVINGRTGRWFEARRWMPIPAASLHQEQEKGR